MRDRWTKRDAEPIDGSERTTDHGRELTRRRTMALAASGVIAGTTGIARGQTNQPNAEVYEDGDQYVAENHDREEVVYSGDTFLTAMQAAVDSLSGGRTRKETVRVSATGEVGPHSWDGDVAGVDLPSYTTFEVTGRIDVTDTGDELVIPVQARSVHDIEIPELTVTGNPRYGMKLESVSDVAIGDVTMSLGETTDVGIGVRIDNARGGRTRNVSIDRATVRGAAGHGLETYGVDGFDVGTVETVDTGGCGLLLNDTSDATIDRVDATRADQGGGYAGFRCANDAGPDITLSELKAVDCGRGFFFVSGSHGIELHDVDVENCGGCLIQDTRDAVVDGGSIHGNDGSGVRIDSRSSDRHPHTRNVTVQNLELTGNSYGVRETGPGTEENAVLDNYLCDNATAPIETYAPSTTVQGNVSCGTEGAPIEDGTYRITNVATGQVLEVDGGSDDDGANVQQWAYWGGANQHWELTREADGYRIENVSTGKVLDVARGSTINGANVHQWSDHGGDNQRFELLHGEGRSMRIEALHSGRVLDVVDGSSDHGANVQQWADWGGSHQHWTFESV